MWHQESVRGASKHAGFSYALARVRQQRLLFKGEDLAQTHGAPVV